jgi:MFS family permease
VAAPDYNRWLIPPAALAIHLSIGMAYGFSVFWLPLSRAVGITTSAADDWSISTLGWMYTLFFVMLGSSAAVFGPWLEREGPRKAGVAAACCWGGGFLVSAVGVYRHEIAWLWLGSGVIGGCGLGLGYISPVSTLMKWFPDRRGLATGLAIMGFGGGAMIGSPLADALMRHFATPTSVGVWQTFVVMGLLYLVAMLAGAWSYRVPPDGWHPEGGQVASPATSGPVTVSTAPDVAWRTGTFWKLWVVLCLNVSAGIGVLGVASPMIQEVFPGRVDASAAAGFTGLLSLFNIGGRLFWASLSDWLGRPRTYFIFFALGMALYAAVPWASRTGNLLVFVALFAVILTMYGGGFAAIPAYLADVFGVGYVGAIHGRLLTAWSTAGILGPVLVNYLREYQLARGLTGIEAYAMTMWVLVGLLGLGLLANSRVRLPRVAPVPGASGAGGVHTRTMSPVTGDASTRSGRSRQWALVAVAWTAVLLPLLWGVWRTLTLAGQLLGL